MTASTLLIRISEAAAKYEEAEIGSPGERTALQELLQQIEVADEWLDEEAYDG